MASGVGELDTTNLLHAAALLTGRGLAASTESAAPTLEHVLLRRLSEYRAYCSIGAVSGETSLELAQQHTALEALRLLELLHDRLRTDASTGPQPTIDDVQASHTANPRQEGPSDIAVGAKDLGLIRTLVSIVFRWGTEPLTRRISASIPARSATKRVAAASIIDLTSLPEDTSTLVDLITRLLRLPLPHGTDSTPSQSAITATLLNKHLADLLPPAILLGWLPKSLSSEAMPTSDALRQPVMHLLSRLPASLTISSLGQVLSKAPPLAYYRKACSFLLSRQVVRPEGVRGLCEAMFAEEEMSGADAPLEKLEHVARTLQTVPPGMSPQDYFGAIVPRIFHLLATEDDMPPAHRRAVAFSLSRLLVQDAEGVHPSTVALPLLHGPLLDGSGLLPIASVLHALEIILTNTDPSPVLISTLLTPIVPSLYALHAQFDAAKVANPMLKERIKGFLMTWGKLMGLRETLDTLWAIIQDGGGKWRVDIAGNISRTDGTAVAETLSLFTPESLKQAEDAGDFDVDSNVLGLDPDPPRFIAFVQSFGRADVSSEFFIKLLDAYRVSRAQADADPLRTLLLLQLVVQMQKQIAGDDASSLLKKPDHILSFIKHALESPRLPTRSANKPGGDAGTGLRMGDLRIVEDDDDELDEDDSDDEGGADVAQGYDEMTSTAVNLLLSVLEANPTLSARTAPVLNDIFALLEPLAKVQAEELRSLAREARMVMTARLASTSGASVQASSTEGAESPQETYQQALKLLQDPLLPVRAHGLMLLRQLVSSTQSKAGTLGAPVLDRALVPGILSIFLQSIQDDDSYMYLNAVQGLAAMVDGYGHDVLRGLVKTYADGLEGLGATALSQHDVDLRTRVGEALGQVIRRCGGALPSYASALIPPLFRLVRTTQCPTVLRSSALALLAQCAKTNALAVLPYAVDLADAMVDLLQVESVPAEPRARAKTTSGDAGAPENPKEAPRAVDVLPTSTDAKSPPLRRAALHLLSLLFQACVARLYETGDAEADGLLPPPRLVARARTTLGYVAATDADDVVRVMAREAAEVLEQLAEAVLGV